MPPLTKFLPGLILGHDLNATESYAAAQALIASDVDPISAGALLCLLAAKGETVTELLGFHRALSQSGRQLKLIDKFVDIVGTGGDHSGSLNISTGAALLTAACGVPVVKHGNRAVSSRCGAADVLSELGYNLNLDEHQLAAELAQSNFAFCFAQNYYPGLRNLAAIRKQLGIPTIFNLLGPLLNPAGRQHLILGVYAAKYVPLLAQALFELGTIHSIVFHGNGLDELTCMGKIEALEVTLAGIQPLVIDPQQLGLTKIELADLAGGDRMYNAQMLQRSLNGEPSSLSQSLALNAGVALYLYGKVGSIAAGVEQAQARLGQARLATGKIVKLNKLQQIIARKYSVPAKRKSMRAALLAKQFAVISEIKRASPSAGMIATIEDPLLRAQQYVAVGAAAISVLTDAGFNGSLADLQRVSQGLAQTPVPILCKDFMLNTPQIAAAAAAGADVILLIVHVLQERTIELAKVAHEFGLEVLVEVHNPQELALALQANADIIGVNQRDLNDFSLHPEQFAELIKLIPANMVKVAESGIKTREQALQTLALGYDGILVGEALSRLANPAEFFGIN